MMMIDILHQIMGLALKHNALYLCTQIQTTCTHTLCFLDKCLTCIDGKVTTTNKQKTMHFYLDLYYTLDQKQCSKIFVLFN